MGQERLRERSPWCRPTLIVIVPAAAAGANSGTETAYSQGLSS